jgi:uncharacterized protein YfdQ (DUF2303 family)
MDLSKENLATLVEIARASQLQIVELPDGRRLVATPQAGGGVSVNEYQSADYLPPLQPLITAHPTVIAKDSFVAYINAFKTSTARMFATLNDSGGGQLLAVLDYHAGQEAGQPVAPGRCAHRVAYQLRDSEEWARWSKISGKMMGQTEFVRFLEENAADVSAPAGADILEMARDFSAARKVDFTQSVRTDTGDVSFEYAANAEAKSKAGQIEVPRKFELTIPVFYGEPTMKVYAFLRWSIADGSLQLGIELARPVYVRQSLLEEIGGDVISKTGVPLHYGVPAGSI